MNPGNQLVIGIVLIAAGLALAILGYIIFSNRGEREKETDDAPPPSPEMIDSSDESESEEELPLEAEPPAEAKPEDINLPPWVIPQDELAQEVPEEIVEPTPVVPVETADEDEPALPPTDNLNETGESFQRSINIATILRDEVTGQILIKVGDREYDSPDTLRASPDWTKVEYAAKDLVDWIETAEPALKPGDRPRESSPGPKSMIQQINDILQDELADTSSEKKGIRLMESADGSVKVLLGVHSYPLDDVPDDSVQSLIRKAVAIWENRQ